MEAKKTSISYSPEVRDRAVRLVQEGLLAPVIAVFERTQGSEAGDQAAAEE